jgi:hypothetical protein
MNKIITPITLASKIWFRTAAILSITVLVFVLIVEPIGIFIVPAFFIGFVGTLGASIPVLVSLFYFLCCKEQI